MSEKEEFSAGAMRDIAQSVEERLKTEAAEKSAVAERERQARLDRARKHAIEIFQGPCRDEIRNAAHAGKREYHYCVTRFSREISDYDRVLAGELAGLLKIAGFVANLSEEMLESRNSGSYTSYFLYVIISWK